MWKMSKRLAACMFAAAWWGIFYPELCFSEDTCAVVCIENEEEAAIQSVHEKEAGTQSVQERGEKQLNGSREIDATAVWRASGDRIIMRSRLWEWCEENLFDEP